MTLALPLRLLLGDAIALGQSGGRYVLLALLLALHGAVLLLPGDAFALDQIGGRYLRPALLLLALGRAAHAPLDQVGGGRGGRLRRHGNLIAYGDLWRR